MQGEPGAWYAMLPLEMCYAYDPVPPEPPVMDVHSSPAAAPLPAPSPDAAPQHGAEQRGEPDAVDSEDDDCRSMAGDMAVGAARSQAGSQDAALLMSTGPGGDTPSAVSAARVDSDGSMEPATSLRINAGDDRW